MADQPLRSVTWLGPVAQGYNGPTDGPHLGRETRSRRILSLVFAGRISEKYRAHDTHPILNFRRVSD